MNIGYMYDFKAWPPKGGNHVHALELTQNFLALGHFVAVLDDETMPGAENFGYADGGLPAFIQAIDVLYVRIDARPTMRWGALKEAQDLAAKSDKPIVWEINAPANEALAYSWLGGRAVEDGVVEEGLFRRARRYVHALRQTPRIAREEAHRKKLASQVAGAICVSSSLAAYAAEDLRIEAVLSLPNGGPLLCEKEISRRGQRTKAESFTVLYSGSAMYPWQGLDLIFETIKLANAKSADVHFVLAVNQPIPGFEGTENVTVRQGLNREELLDAICGADVCVALHPEYPWSKYGFHNSPMKLFEYLACKRPVIASNHGQMQALFENSEAVYLVKNDPLEILKKIDWLEKNPGQAALSGDAGWRLVNESLNWHGNATRSVTFFIDCMKERKQEKPVRE